MRQARRTVRRRAPLDSSEHEISAKLSTLRARPILTSGGMKLQDLIAGAGVQAPLVNPKAQISSVVYDSRQATDASLFVAIRGEKTDGNRFIGAALEHGATAIVTEMPPPGQRGQTLGAQVQTPEIAPAAVPDSVAWLQVPDARKALAIIAANFYDHPADKLQLVGITGTNGKTTTSFLIDSIVHAAGLRSGLFGTIEYRTPLETYPAKTTTPESLDLQRFFFEIVRAGGTYAVLESSSHALALDRLWGCRFAAAVFTNLTRDHLDFHNNMENYFAAKRRLFEGTGAGRPLCGVINIDDPYGQQLRNLAERTITYGLGSGAQVTVKKFALALRGLDFVAETPAGKIEVRSPLVGRNNVYNVLAAIAAGMALDIQREAIEAGIAALSAVPGRFERIDLGQPFMVVVDYAHTDDALQKLLETARELHPTGRMITLFGCGGERDRSKRPLMGAAAGRLSDIVVLSSDNPRSEDPLKIINDAVVGLQRTTAKVLVEPDRERALELAIEQARPGDIVLLAGKGHETTQVLKDRTIGFDDREVARRILRDRGYGG
jgi:UDP-N-acetylmuramoyl-L-alanyl-D-glutamate--2,6-diaminopimelate ligase